MSANETNKDAVETPDRQLNDEAQKPDDTTGAEEKPPPEKVLRFALTIGQRALSYGSIGLIVEQFLTSLVKQLGYDGEFFVLSAELVGSTTIPQGQDEEDPFATALPTVTMVKAPGGMDLYKLTLLSDVAKDIVAGKINIEEALVDKIPEIDQKKDPYNSLIQCFVDYMFAGASLPVVLGGSGWDCLAGAMGAILCWGVIIISDRFSKFLGTWTMALCAFLPAILVTGMKIHKPVINVTIATLSAVAIPLPGFGVSVGLAELAALKIIRGMSHFLGGVITLFWLVLGSWLGVLFVEACATVPPSTAPDPVPQVWQWLAIPMLALCLPVAFQVAPRDMFWAFAASGITYAVQYGSSFFASGNVSVFFASAVATGYCNLWARIFDRPASIVMTPPMVFLVSGSIGFRGIASIIEGEKHLGTQQFVDMIVVALLIVDGVYVGNTVIRPVSTL